ncbi:signal peptidase I [Neisseriaceae bacterium PsAf]|nr:signal peptidase I [Neisseriaceae bacterium PsAf]MCV2502765.1 signal peptidase I [Neisseriaceae bacterium]
MFGGLSFLVVGCVLLFLAIILFFMADKTALVEEGNLPPLIDWSFLLLVIGIFCLLSEFFSFGTVFLVMTVLTGLAYLIYHFYRKSRQDDIEELSAWHLVDYFKGFFWIFFIIFTIRSFIVDLSIIPSSSMRPGLVVGDFVLVSKYDYGVKMPISNKTLISNKPVARGDVIVFDFPLNRKIQYVKRVIGIRGDKVEFRNKNLIINGQEISKESLGMKEYLENSYNIATPYNIEVEEFHQKIDNTEFNIYEIPNRPTLDADNVKSINPCVIEGDNGIVCEVPEGKYFVLGDNRDNSEDGRYWGFVDELDIQGKAFFVWMNFKEPKRIGTKVK